MGKERGIKPCDHYKTQMKQFANVGVDLGSKDWGQSTSIGAKGASEGICHDS